jgi:hypothetical protein
MPPEDQQSTRWFVGAVAVVIALVAVVAAALWWLGGDDGSSDDAADGGSTPTSSPTTPAPSRHHRQTPAPSPTEAPGKGDRRLGNRAEGLAGGVPEDARVLVISVDGLASWAVTPTAAPNLTGLLADGAGTLDARTEVEQTVTLPNHTGMVTSERVDAAAGGHGVTWNETEPGRNVAPGVSSMFQVVHAAGGSSAVYAGKDKFELWTRAWPGTIDDFRISGDEDVSTDQAIASVRSGRDLTFLHLKGPDELGHLSGWGSPAYLGAVTDADADIGRAIDAITADPDLADRMVVIVTADHGGVRGTDNHVDATSPQDYTIPFVVWGAGIADGDLYDLNPDYRDPGATRPTYDGPLPVRNADVANLVTGLLGLGPVPGSELDARQDLTVTEE